MVARDDRLVEVVLDAKADNEGGEEPPLVPLVLSEFSSLSFFRPSPAVSDDIVQIGSSWIDEWMADACMHLSGPKLNEESLRGTTSVLCHQFDCNSLVMSDFCCDADRNKTLHLST